MGTTKERMKHKAICDAGFLFIALLAMHTGLAFKQWVFTVQMPRALWP